MSLLLEYLQGISYLVTYLIHILYPLQLSSSFMNYGKVKLASPNYRPTLRVENPHMLIECNNESAIL